MRKSTYTYHITSATEGRRARFQKHDNARILMEVILEGRTKAPYRLHAFAVMPDHFHALITPGDVTVEKCAQLIKGGASFRLGLGPIWQRSFNQQTIRNEEMYANAVAYIEANPEAEGLREWSFVSDLRACALDPAPSFSG